MTTKKIANLKNLIGIAKNLKSQNKKIITTNGVFDILHAGHVSYLQYAKKLGDVLIVGINSDSSVRQIKGEKRPINDEKSRAKVLAALECVDYVFVFGEKNPIAWLSKIKPNFHVKAGDYKIEEILEKAIVEKNAGKIVIAKMVNGYSTTSLIKKIFEAYNK